MIQAILVTIIAWFQASMNPIAWCVFREPVMVGFWVGLIYGKPVEGVIVGAAINLTYLGWISTGGANPTDMYYAGLFGTLLALQTDLTTAAAVALAIPIGAIGNYVWISWMSVNTIFPSMMDKCAEKGDYKGIVRLQALGGPLTCLVLRGIPAFLVAYFGGDVIQPLLNALPAWSMSGFTVVGKVLPALGLAMLLKYMGRKDLLPFFGLGFIISAYFEMTDLVFFALLGGALALIYLSLLKNNTQTDEAEVI